MRKSRLSSPLYCLYEVISTEEMMAIPRASIRYLSIPITGKINAIIITKNTIPERMRSPSNSFDLKNKIVNIETVKYMRSSNVVKTLTHNYPFF